MAEQTVSTTVGNAAVNVVEMERSEFTHPVFAAK